MLNLKKSPTLFYFFFFVYGRVFFCSDLGFIVFANIFGSYFNISVARCVVLKDINIPSCVFLCDIPELDLLDGSV